MTLKEGLAWAAGFFDGEGSTSFVSCKPKERAKSKRLISSIRMNMAQVDLNRLENFFKVVGVGAIRGPYKYGSNKQPHYQWNVSSLDVLTVLDKLWPFLSLGKKLQALKAVYRYEEYLNLYPPKVNQYDQT